MTEEQNRIIEVMIQSFTVVPTVAYTILTTQFLFFAIVKYFSVLIEDVKEVIKQFNRSNIREQFIEMIRLHHSSLK